MRHGSLFSGIGGFDLAAKWMGWDNVFHCEIDPFCQRTLKFHFPNSIAYADIKSTDFTLYRGSIDILSGGFPCQPFSQSGKRLGKQDQRHLWPEMCRAIKEIRPRWVVGENVYGIINWSGGLVFHEVQSDLEAQGYEVQPYVLPVAGIGGVHRRDRVFFIAHSNNTGDISSRSRIDQIREENIKNWHSTQSELSRPRIERTITDTDNDGRSERHRGDEVRTSDGRINAFDNAQQSIVHGNTTDPYNSSAEHSVQTGRDLSSSTSEQNYSGRGNWEDFPTVSPVCDGNDGFPDRLDGITFSKWRTESIKAAGNSVCPKLVFKIFQTIEQYEKTTNTI